LSEGLPTSAKLSFADIAVVLRIGARRFRAAPGVSMTYASVFAAAGLILLGALGVFGISPMALPFAGGFMLLGPVLLTGYFELSRKIGAHEKVNLVDAFAAFGRAPAGLWIVALICAFLFLVWITDAGVLYTFTVGGAHLPYSLAWVTEWRADVLAFELWASLMGSVIAYMIFAVSAFSVPLLYERRTNAVQAIHTSVRLVLGHFWVCITWGLLLAASVMLSILLLPALLVTLPVMAYTSYALYERALPP
jgi:uncharacterized membrane protein